MEKFQIAGILSIRMAAPNSVGRLSLLREPVLPSIVPPSSQNHRFNSIE